MNMTTRGALVAAAFVLIWVQWGLLAAFSIAVAACLGALVAGAMSGELDLGRTLRELQDRS